MKFNAAPLLFAPGCVLIGAAVDGGRGAAIAFVAVIALAVLAVLVHLAAARFASVSTRSASSSVRGNSAHRGPSDESLHHGSAPPPTL